MIGLINPKRNYLTLFLLFLCIELSVSSDIKELELNESTKSFNISKEEKIKLASKNETTLPNYLKIELEGKKTNNDYIISYYKDSSFKERKQLSQSSSGKSVMWLSKAQLKGGFYLSLECYTYPCDLTLKTIFKDTVELNFERPYTYYVTEENKEMSFNIKGTPVIKYFDNEEKSKTNCKISVWIKGNKGLESELNSTNIYSKKNKGYHAYVIDKQEPKEINLKFKVKANVGDLIEVGALFINGENYVQTKINFGVLGLFKKGVLEYIKIKDISGSSFIDLYDQEALVYPSISSINSETIKMQDMYGHNDYFYSFELKENRKEYDNKLYQFSPLIDGVMHQIKLEKDKTFGFIPMKPDNDFQYLTYYAKEMYGMLNASILNCENYPLCKMNLTIEKPLLNYNSSSIIYKNNDYKDISPISKNQKILLLRNKDSKNLCEIFLNMYTNKHNVTLRPEVTFLKNIKENTEENFIISLSTILPTISKLNMTKFKFYINIEKLSGDIEVELKGTTPIKHSNKFLYEKESEKTDFFNFKIKAKKNSVYNIAIYYEKESKFLTPQANYLLKFNDTSNISQINIAQKGSLKESFVVSFYNLISKISAEKVTEKPSPIKETNNFFQDFYDKSGNYKYSVKLQNKTKDSNLYSISIFRIDAQYINSAILAKGEPHRVLFDNSKYKKINYLYLHDEENEDVKINFTLFDDSKFDLEIFLNDKKSQNYTISKNLSHVELAKNVLKNNIVNNQPCKINFVVTPKDLKNNSIMEINIISNENSKSGSQSESKKGGFFNIFNNKIILIGGSIILFLLIILIIVICLLCRGRSIYKDLTTKIGQTSFVGGENTGRAVEERGDDEELLS